MAKGITSHPSTAFNHDGKAFNGFIRSTPSDVNNENATDSTDFDKVRDEYQRNLKSGKWRPFVNGE